MNIADAFESVVEAAVQQIDEHLLDRFVVIFRIDALGGSKLFRCKTHS